MRFTEDNYICSVSFADIVEFSFKFSKVDQMITEPLLVWQSDDPFGGDRDAFLGPKRAKPYLKIKDMELGGRDAYWHGYRDIDVDYLKWISISGNMMEASKDAFGEWDVFVVQNDGDDNPCNYKKFFK